MGGVSVDCRFDRGLLQDYLDGAIEPIEKLFVEEHLKVCKKCKKELSELKLLFWDLEDLKKEETEIPPELPEMRKKVLDKLFENNEKSMGVEEFFSLQRKIASNAGLYLKLMPGAGKGERLLKESVKKAPAAVARVSAGILKGGYKIMRMRLQT